MLTAEAGNKGARFGRKRNFGMESLNERRYGGGMEFIKAMRRAEMEFDAETPKPPNTLLNSFGVVDETGRYDITLRWKVDGYRKDLDKVLNPEPAGLSNYSNSLLDSMFAGWK